MTSKQKYRIHCEKEPTIPIFSQAWWLDATAGDDWDVVIIENNKEIIASLPFVIRKNKLGFTLLTQPRLTQHLGPWLKISSEKYALKLGQEKDLIQELFSKLPKHDYYIQNWYFERTNWLPLYWMGYSQTTRYTYRINNLSDFDLIWNGLQTNTRKRIKHCKEDLGIVVRTDLNIDDFIKLNRQVFYRQGMEVPYSDDLVYRIDEAASKNKAKQIFIAEDPKGRRHGALFLIWDSNSAYSIMEGSDPELRGIGANSLIRWEAVKFASGVTKHFDFEGSMIEGVERSYRAFGAIQTPYFSITKTNSKVLRFLQIIRSIVK